MTDITSKNNQVYKLFQKLAAKKYRDRLGLYLIEGKNLIEEAVKNGASIEKVIVRKDDDATDFLTGTIGREISDDKILFADKNLFRDIAQTETSQGVIAAVAKPVFSLEDFIKDGAPGNFVVLDRLQDPGNIGTIIRTADAAGYSLVAALKGTADLFSPKVVRAATGSLFRVPIVFLDSVEELTELARRTGKRIVASCLEDSQYYYEQDLSQNIVLVVGNEGSGISRELIEKSDLKIKIPMSGNIESLNASVAAAIIMYESVRAKGLKQSEIRK